MKVKFPFLNKRFESGKFKIEKGKLPYIRKDGNIAGFEIWIVDGDFVRNNICEDFVNMGEHYFLNFIPKNEFWIAQEATKGEENFYVDYLLIENRLMSCGVSYDEAATLAAQVERKERNKSLVAKKFKKIKSKSELVKKIHKKLFRELGDIKAWIVSGELVRDFFDIYYTGGGHDKVYNFIPKKEIWIDDDIEDKERKFILLHEIHERNLMAKGWNYKRAHFSATEVEDFARHHPRRIDSLIKAEINSL